MTMDNYMDSELGDFDQVELVDCQLLSEVETMLVATATIKPLAMTEVRGVHTMYHNSFQRRQFGKPVQAVQHCTADMQQFMIVNNGNDHGQVGCLNGSIFHDEREALLQGLEELDAELRMFQRIRGEVLYRLKKLEEEQAIKGEQHAQAEAGY